MTRKAFFHYSSQEEIGHLQVTTFALEICQKDFSTNEETFRAHPEVLQEERPHNCILGYALCCSIPRSTLR